MVGRATTADEPRIVVVPEGASATWPRLIDEAATVVTRDAVQSAVADQVARRDEAIASQVAELELQLGDLVAELDDVAARRVEQEEDHAALLRWADWCEAQPAEAADGVGAVAEATRVVEQRSAEARQAGRELDDVLEQQATAEAALEEARMEVEAHSAPGLAESDVRQELERAEKVLASASSTQEETVARRRVEVLHRTLAVRAEPRSQDTRHHEAVRALARQAEALQARLSEAVETARARSDAALRSLAQAEQLLERLHHRERGRHRRLRDAVAELPAELRPRTQDDLLAESDAVAASLRTHAESLLPELDELRRAVDGLVARREDVHLRIDSVRATIGRAEDDDVVRAVRALVEAADPPVVLDDPLSPEEWPAVMADLAARPPDVPVSVLTADPAVLAWAIDLPSSIGGVVLSPFARHRGESDRAESADAAGTSPTAAPAESLQFEHQRADAQGAGETRDEPLIDIERLRAFAFRSHSEPRSSDEP